MENIKLQSTLCILGIFIFERKQNLKFTLTFRKNYKASSLQSLSVLYFAL